MLSKGEQEILTVLSNHPLFQNLDEELLQFLADHSQVCWFEPGHLIFREGDEAGTFYLIQSGQVALEFFLTENALYTLETLGEGDIVGWSWLFPPFRWHLNARALTRVQAIAFDAAALRQRMEADPAQGMKLVQRFSRIIFQRLQAARQRLAQTAGRKEQSR
ncbi:MAG: Crp/Fnr family transcriptional regulator [Calditrichaeota bacterium]|nr:MAG: Crp/Fnr family transcriptional regulator [Calditrichota bacterium]